MVMAPIAIKWGTVVAAFENDAEAQAAIQELRYLGFSASQIGFATRLDNGPHFHAVSRLILPTWFATAWGLEILAGTMPGIGSAIAGGILAVLLSNNRAVGDTSSGPAGALIDLGVTDNDAQHYEGELAAYKTIVTVKAGSRAEIANIVLNRATARR